jgi:hypothetical protein
MTLTLTRRSRKSRWQQRKFQLRKKRRSKRRSRLWLR